jgi:phenylacetyl-CoA:acceptor oxidoreductase 27-kDa subunit
MPKWGMIIDLRKCINCEGCEIVCSQTNEVPLNSRREIWDFGLQIDSDKMRVFMPMSCLQCNQPPCLDVCPTTATYKRVDGIVDIDSDLCIGCGYCVVSCPYNARTIIDDKVINYHFFKFIENVGFQEFESIMGTCTKCNFCAEKIDKGLEMGLEPGKHEEATPSCVNTCPANALHFGDLSDPYSKVNQILQEESCEVLHEGAETDPSLFYILPDGYTFSHK